MGAGWTGELGKIESLKDNGNVLIKLNCTYVYRIYSLNNHTFYVHIFVFISTQYLIKEILKFLRLEGNILKC